MKYTALLAASVASSTPILGGAPVTGQSTFYEGNLNGGTCSFNTYALPVGVFGVAFSGAAWQDASVCGACMEVTGPNGNTITAMVVDQCPECDEGHLDLFKDAFEQIGNPVDGIIPTSYHFVPCGVPDPITLINKSGTSPFWFSMQVVNPNEPVDRLEVSVDGGATWQPTQRQYYNYFENSSGFGTDTVDVKVTSSLGKEVIVNGVSVADGAHTLAGGNFW